MRMRVKTKSMTRGRKGIYVLPNLLTSASLFGGFYAIIAAIQHHHEAAAVAVLISCVLDALDGKVARYTRTASHFGTEYDSLSDLVAFGIAPGVLAFQWALEPFGRLGWMASFIYVICGALRLARFNVERNVEMKYFKGLPIPVAASFVASSILFSVEVQGGFETKPALIITVMYVLSFLMVSTLDYFSFKELNLKKRKPFNLLVSIVLVLVVIAYKPRIMIFFISALYILSGLVLTAVRHQRRRSLANQSHKVSMQQGGSD